VVEELADRIGIIDHGRLIACGSMAALRSQSAVDGSLEDVFLKLTEEGEPMVPEAAATKDTPVQKGTQRPTSIRGTDGH
jgi:ABC-2 type transport system ATP-binding protein